MDVWEWMFLPGAGWLRTTSAEEMDKRVWREHVIKSCDHEWRKIAKGEISEESQRAKGWSSREVILSQCEICEVYLILPDV